MFNFFVKSITFSLTHSRWTSIIKKHHKGHMLCLWNFSNFEDFNANWCSILVLVWLSERHLWFYCLTKQFKLCLLGHLDSQEEDTSINANYCIVWLLRSATNHLFDILIKAAFSCKTERNQSISAKERSITTWSISKTDFIYSVKIAWLIWFAKD